MSGGRSRHCEWLEVKVTGISTLLPSQSFSLQRYFSFVGCGAVVGPAVKSSRPGFLTYGRDRDGFVTPEGNDNILSRIPSRYMADALLALPDPELVSDGAIMDAFIDVPLIGRVRITARRMKHKRGRSMRYFWTAERATIV
jgi:hypothetical protein